MFNRGLFSSARGDWKTPTATFAEWHRRFRFTVDAAATEVTTQLPRFYRDGLAQLWRGRVWCNPPYGRNIGRWVRQGFESAQAGAAVVMLLPARTDTRWFHDYVMHANRIVFLKGRLHFDERGRAPFPSMIVIFKRKEG